MGDNKEIAYKNVRKVQADINTFFHELAIYLHGSHD